jgi:hypothetical protein
MATYLSVKKNKHLQIYLHPYMFSDELDNLPPYMEIVKPDDVKIFNNKIKNSFSAITGMCSGLNTDYLKYNLLTSTMIIYFYSQRKLLGMIALILEDDNMHIETICTNTKSVSGAGRFLMDTVNYIGSRLGKNKITLDAIDQAIPFYEKLNFTSGEKDFEKNTTPMEIEIKPVSLESVPNMLSLRKSMRKSLQKSLQKSRSAKGTTRRRRHRRHHHA